MAFDVGVMHGFQQFAVPMHHQKTLIEQLHDGAMREFGPVLGERAIAGAK